ncbi:MAG: hypothetical protein ACREYF_28565 [Gammaproteobacteria bacterium]
MSCRTYRGPRRKRSVKTSLGLTRLLRYCARPMFAAERLVRCGHQSLSGHDCPGARRRRSRAFLAATFEVQNRIEDLFIVDPQSNLILRYENKADPEGVLKNLKRLLKYSWIG